MRSLRALALASAFALVLAAPVVALRPIVAQADAAKGPTLDVDGIKEGQKGYGLTVFKGTEPEKFDVEVIGVLHKFRPNQDLVLVKTMHERLQIAHTVAGMSGSPIYLDGKMIGAYAYGWTFGSEAIAGVTPIKNMLGEMARPIPPELLKPLLPSPKVPHPKRADLDAVWDGALADYDVKKHAEQIGAKVAPNLKPPSGTSLAAASTPVLLSGLGERSAETLSSMLAPMGFDTQQGGGTGAGKPDPNAPQHYVDGGAIGVQLIRGDISAMGLGTVTRVEGEKLVAFGHPMMQGGISLLPTAIGRVHWIMASAQRSFKIGEPVVPLGALVNDQQAAIVCDEKVSAPTFPVTVDVEGMTGAPKTHWENEIAHDKFLAPAFVGTAMGNTVESTLSERRDVTWTATSKIFVKNYGSIEIQDFGVASGGTPNGDDFVRSRAVRAVGMIMNNPWEPVVIEKVEMKMKVTFSRDVLGIRGSTVLDEEVDAGHKARVAVKLKQFNGPDETRTIEIPIPASLAGHELDIDLVPGWQETPDLPTPDSLAALMANLPRLSFAPDSLLAVYRLKDGGVMFNGQVATELPPSALDALRPSHDSISPEAIPSTVRIPFPIGHFVEGRDRVHVRVREVLRLPSLSRRAKANSSMTFLRRALVSLAALATAAVCVSPRAEAVGTRAFDLDSLDEFLGGDLRGVAIDTQGRVRAGWNLGTHSLPEVSAVWSSVVLADGSALLGTSSGGKILKVSGGQVSVFANTEQIAVTSLALGAGGAIYAATLPAGKIFKLDGQGKATELPKIVDADNVLGLAFDAKKNVLYAATGPHGKLFSIDAQGNANVLFDSDEGSLTSVAVADDGSVLAGSSGKGLVYKISGPGRATIVLDCPGDEAKAIAPAKGGAAYVVCNEFGETGGDAPRRNPNAAVGQGSPTSNPRSKAGKGSLFRVEADGRTERLFGLTDTHFTSLALDDEGRPFVGTGVEGRVFTVDDNHTVTLMADTDERQIGALVLTGKTKFVASSDPAVFHPIEGLGGADATWTSKVFDAGFRANFGRVSWRSEGSVEVSMRSGNAGTPDATWSDWSTALTAPGKTNVPPGRFVQVRARFDKQPNALLREVHVPYVIDNLRAVVTNVESAPKTTAEKGSDIPARSPVLHLTWKVDNPDGDALRYRVSYRFDTQANTFREITKPDEVQSKAELDWDTASLPEGTYRVRVEASDETANPPDKVTKHALESGPILVDNTPPVFRALSATGRKIHAEVVDGLGPIARVDFAVDGRTDWRPLAPTDGVFDEPSETLDADLASVVGAGSHLVAVRAFDAAGNIVTRDVELK